MNKQQRIGHVMPDLLPPAGGSRGSLRDLIQGKRAAAVVFWSGVCSHCARYDELLNNFTLQHPEIGLFVIACRQGETRQDVHDTAVARELSFPILYDEDRSVARAWLVYQTPRVFLVDCQLRLLYRGAIDNFKYPGDPGYRGYLKDALSDFLAGRPISRAETAGFGCAIESVYYALPKPLLSRASG